MCLIVFAYRVHPDYPLLLASNRDEFHARPTAPAAWWRSGPAVLGGRDLEAGGTWLALDRRGRMAAVTNYRKPDERSGSRPSRGRLVTDFLAGDRSAAASARAAAGRGEAFAGFNLLLFDGARLWYASNRGGGVAEVEPGVHGLSNSLLDSPWPKVERGVARLRAALAASRPGPGALLDALGDETVPPDEALPDTGLGLEKERLLGPCFIVSPDYGTRAASALLVRGDGTRVFAERSFDPEGRVTGERAFRVAPLR
jgi:uncharacterized protein with NRDE domain